MSPSLGSPISLHKRFWAARKIVVPINICFESFKSNVGEFSSKKFYRKLHITHFSVCVSKEDSD